MHIHKRNRILCLLMGICLLFPLLTMGEESSPYTLPENKTEREILLCDRDYRTYLTIHRGNNLTCRIDTPGEPLLLEWRELPQSYTLELLDKKGEILSRQERSGSTFHEYLHTENAAELRLFGSNDLKIAELRTLQTGETIFASPAAPCDALILLREPGEEYSLASPVLEELRQKGLTIQLVYLLSSDRDRMGEVMEYLSALGIFREPVFLSLKQPQADTRDAAQNKWANMQLNVILSCAPRLLVLGKGGMCAYIWELMQKQGLTPEKVYALDDYGSVLCAMEETAVTALKEVWTLQRSQQLYKQQPAVEAALTPLIGEGSLLDGMDTADFLTYATPTPFPTAAPTPSPTYSPADTEIPSTVPSPSEQKNQEDTGDTPGLISYLLPGALMAFLAVAFAGGKVANGKIKRPQRPKKKTN